MSPLLFIIYSKMLVCLSLLWLGELVQSFFFFIGFFSHSLPPNFKRWMIAYLEHLSILLTYQSKIPEQEYRKTSCKGRKPLSKLR